ncbi:MAG: hypothetical protein WA642_12730 [Steroidobacteraceae bacterium]
MLTASIGAMFLLAFATLKWKKRKSTLADAMTTKSVLDLAEGIVTEHAPELTLGRKQLTMTLCDGRVDDSKWLEERDFFIDHIVEPQVGNITNSLERLLAVWEMIDDATAQFAASRTTELPVPPAATGDGIDAPAATTVVARAA